MDDLREKVIKGLECCSKGADREPTWNNLTARNCGKCPYNKPGIACTRALSYDALSLLKEQEQEISRLKHHMDCDAAEKLPSGCVGYGRGFNDDEPCETCKACEKYNGYGEE